ncbi:hypothetical protein [Candidatus Lariskella endosymbiont of Hedychridium roseum]|uniref:hypothetical protein n=1 Tax=Candidatus Lariskella endosymbiont of Hedychridium roseum TaxID=3077949 RepID=UPI0030D2E481
MKVGYIGKIISGDYSPYGEILIKDDTAESGGYYIYIWPKDGTKWPNSKHEIMYDVWLEDCSKIQQYFSYRKWVIDLDNK